MHSTLRTLRNLYRNERGGTAIEYGLILALVVLVVLTAIAALGTTVTDVWNGVLTNVIQHTGHA